jgi:fibro-slime domain-containing protein
MLALVAISACSSATILDRGSGAGAGSGAHGGAGGGGGLVVNLDASAGRSDAERPGGGVCGDGIIQRSEQCDDGNTQSGDGCSRLCQVEANWGCPTEGKPCEYLGTCGNGVLTANKACDDGNTKSGDGCSGDCQTVEPGYICRRPGKPCTTLCGDARIMQGEECDDGNSDGGDGCSAICRVEPGWTCSTTTPSTCTHSICGNGKVEAGEGCDDGNALPFDGCSPTCQNEPKCGTTSSVVGACTTSCGDGIQLRGTEECDDGNLLDGDGCSHDCKIEKGNTCRSAYDNPPPTIDIPIVVRDFEGYQNGSPPTGHPDFGHYCCDDSLKRTQGMLRSTLDLDRKPVWAGPDPVPDPSQTLFTGKKEFDQWYRNVSGVNQTFYQNLTLLQDASVKTTYAMNSDTDEPWYDRCGFFPLDSTPRIDPNTGQVMTYTDSAFPGRTCTVFDGLGFGASWANHNYLFTSELRYWFQYQGNEHLKFTGDDDVWVFVNGTLAVDLGGVHNPSAGTVVLDAGNGTGQVVYELPFQGPSQPATIDFKLTKGSVYEVVLFQAERWGGGSNYMLTLANFLAGRSQCGPTCGDGVVTGSEECDNGADNNDTTYGGCTTECRWGPFCGDGVVQGEPDGPEQCDAGKDNGSGGACNIACKKPRSCGDGVVDTDLGEECDLGDKNGVRLDTGLQPVADSSDPTAQVFCSSECRIPPGVVY